MTQMYYEYDIRKEIEKFEKLRDSTPGSESWYNTRIRQLKWVLGESNGKL